MTTQNSVNANSTTPLKALYGGTQLSTLTAHSVLVGNGANSLVEIPLSAGEIVVGNSSGNPAGTTITAGFGIGITSASGSITISNTLPQDAWTDVTTATQTIMAGFSYTASYSGAVTFTLPTSAVYGTTVTIMTGTTSGGWTIAQNAGQAIQFGTLKTTTGTGGSLASTALGDSVTIVCIIANTTWQMSASVGNIVVT